MKKLADLFVPFKRLSSLLLHPSQYFSQDPVRFADGVTAVSLLFLATILQKLAWQEVPGTTVTLGAAAKGAALNTVMAWTGFFAIFYFFAFLFKKRIIIPDLLAATGSASLPLTLATLVSALSWLIGLSIGISNILPVWITIQNVLAWIGLALSWPGLMGFFILRDKLRLPGKRPLILVVMLLVIFFAAWLSSIL